MVMKKYLFLLACAVAMMLPAQAQRLIPKQKGIEVMGSLPIVKGEKLFARDNFGLGLSLTRYLKRENYSFLTVEYEQQNMPYRSYDVKLKDAFVHLGYMQPIVSDNGKNVFAYAGISALGGYEEINDDKPFLPDGAKLLDRSRFVYGGALHLSIECFLSDNVLLLLKGQGRILFGTDVQHFRPAVSAGIRFNL
ncbi:MULTISPECIES: conjugal transfer protein TraO [Prevotella]|uniref:conjugal transfer protein TraO n=1 Tax=Prevotella TaxID=838 RepID=UPI002831A703|nr:conjugal transfer protein TraO [Prevotella brunnea]MDR0185384.1 conjugal transfer protein TraO [Prevotella brunnea]